VGLLKSVPYSKLGKSISLLVDQYEEMSDSEELQITAEKIASLMHGENIGLIRLKDCQLKGATIRYAVPEESGIEWSWLVETSDHKTGQTVGSGKRRKVYYQAYGNFWVTERQMKAWGTTPEELLEIPSSIGGIRI